MSFSSESSVESVQTASLGAQSSRTPRGRSRCAQRLHKTQKDLCRVRVRRPQRAHSSSGPPPGTSCENV